MYLGLCLYLKYKYPSLKGQRKTVLKLSMILSTGCVVWGVLTSAYFGLQITPKSWFGKALRSCNTSSKKKPITTWRGKTMSTNSGSKKNPDVASANTGKEFIDIAVIKVKGAS